MVATITSSKFSHDMGPWCEEKSTFVVRSLASLVDIARKDEEDQSLGISEKLEERLSILSSALWDATKIMAFACGADWQPSHRDLVFEKGFEGYEELAVSYGVLRETSKRRRIRRIHEFVAEYKPLLEGPVSPNRTLIHELLYRCEVSHPLLEQIADLTENVTMGEMEWKVYIEEARTLLGRLWDANPPEGRYKGRNGGNRTSAT